MARILVVDDFEEIVLLAKANIAAPDRHIEGFSDSREALTCLKDEPWDLVITDLMMPVIDGFEMVKAALAKDPVVPSIVLTAHGTAENIKRSLQVECFALLEKPCDWAYLNILVGKALESRRRTTRSMNRF